MHTPAHSRTNDGRYEVKDGNRKQAYMQWLRLAGPFHRELDEESDGCSGYKRQAHVRRACQGSANIAIHPTKNRALCTIGTHFKGYTTIDPKGLGGMWPTTNPRIYVCVRPERMTIALPGFRIYST